MRETIYRFVTADPNGTEADGRLLVLLSRSLARLLSEPCQLPDSDPWVVALAGHQSGTTTCPVRTTRQEELR